MTSSLLGFRPLQVEDRALYLDYYNRARNPMADLTFVSRIAWTVRYAYTYLVYENALIVRNEQGEPKAYSSPMGLENQTQLQRIVDALWKQAEQEGEDHLMIMHIKEEEEAWYQALEGYDVQIENDRDMADYLYDRETLRSLAGKKLHSKRNHIQKFWKLHPDARYEVLNTSHYEACIELTKNWTLARGMDLDSPEASDYQGIKSLIEKALAHDCELKGGVIYEGDQLLAFGIYACDLNEYAVCHFEKASDDVKEAYPVINQLCVENLCEHVKYINREEDMGIEGLRKAKLSYYPLKLLEKRTARIRRKN